MLLKPFIIPRYTKLIHANNDFALKIFNKRVLLKGDGWRQLSLIFLKNNNWNNENEVSQIIKNDTSEIIINLLMNFEELKRDIQVKYHNNEFSSEYSSNVESKQVLLFRESNLRFIISKYLQNEIFIRHENYKKYNTIFKTIENSYDNNQTVNRNELMKKNVNNIRNDDKLKYVLVSQLENKNIRLGLNKTINNEFENYKILNKKAAMCIDKPTQISFNKVNLLNSINDKYIKAQKILSKYSLSESKLSLNIIKQEYMNIPRQAALRINKNKIFNTELLYTAENFQNYFLNNLEKLNYENINIEDKIRKTEKINKNIINSQLNFSKLQKNDIFFNSLKVIRRFEILKYRRIFENKILKLQDLRDEINSNILRNIYGKSEALGYTRNLTYSFIKDIFIQAATEQYYGYLNNENIVKELINIFKENKIQSKYVYKYLNLDDIEEQINNSDEIYVRIRNSIMKKIEEVSYFQIARKNSIEEHKMDTYLNNKKNFYESNSYNVENHNALSLNFEKIYKNSIYKSNNGYLNNVNNDKFEFNPSYRQSSNYFFDFNQRYLNKNKHINLEDFITVLQQQHLKNTNNFYKSMNLSNELISQNKYKFVNPHLINISELRKIIPVLSSDVEKTYSENIDVIKNNNIKNLNEFYGDTNLSDEKKYKFINQHLVDISEPENKTSVLFNNHERTHLDNINIIKNKDIKKLNKFYVNMNLGNENKYKFINQHLLNRSELENKILLLFNNHEKTYLENIDVIKNNNIKKLNEFYDDTNLSDEKKYKFINQHLVDLSESENKTSVLFNNRQRTHLNNINIIKNKDIKKLNSFYRNMNLSDENKYKFINQRLINRSELEIINLIKKKYISNLNNSYKKINLYNEVISNNESEFSKQYTLNKNEKKHVNNKTSLFDKRINNESFYISNSYRRLQKINNIKSLNNKYLKYDINSSEDENYPFEKSLMFYINKKDYSLENHGITSKHNFKNLNNMYSNIFLKNERIKEQFINNKKILINDSTFKNRFYLNKLYTQSKKKDIFIKNEESVNNKLSAQYRKRNLIGIIKNLKEGNINLLETSTSKNNVLLLILKSHISARAENILPKEVQNNAKTSNIIFPKDHKFKIEYNKSIINNVEKLPMKNILSGLNKNEIKIKDQMLSSKNMVLNFSKKSIENHNKMHRYIISSLNKEEILKTNSMKIHLYKTVMQDSISKIFDVVNKTDRIHENIKREKVINTVVRNLNKKNNYIFTNKNEKEIINDTKTIKNVRRNSINRSVSEEMKEVMFNFKKNKILGKQSETEFEIDNNKVNTIINNKIDSKLEEKISKVIDKIKKDTVNEEEHVISQHEVNNITEKVMVKIRKELKNEKKRRGLLI